MLAELGSETLSDGTVIGPQRYCLAASLTHGGHDCGHDGDTDVEPRTARYYDGQPSAAT